MKKPKVVIVGWDGATFDVAGPLLEQGKMPNLKYVMEHGSYGRLKSTIPPITPAAWVSFMLGMGQGAHGIFGFTKPDLRVPNQDFSIENAKRVCKGKTFWEFMEQRDGTRSALLFLPMTYPVWKTNGIMVAGNPIGSMNRNFAYPPTLTQNYKDCFFGRDFYKLHTTNRPEYLRISYRIIENRADRLWDALDGGDFDLVFVVFAATDGSMHTFWKFREPDRFRTDSEEQMRFANAVDKHYIKVDEKLGELLARLGDDCLLCLLSDHGGGATAFNNLHLNKWLQDQGYLFEKRIAGKSWIRKFGSWLQWSSHLRKYLRGLPEFVKTQSKKIGSRLDALDFSRTRAFRVPLQFAYDGIEINLKGRQISGIVEESKYEKLRDEIVTKILELKDPETAQRVVLSAKKREDLFQGENVLYSPDIIIEYDRSYQGAANTERLISKVPRKQIQSVSGAHRLYGIFAFMGKQIEKNNEVEGAAIQDLTPTILHALGYPVPDYMTGKIIEDVFKKDFMNKNPPKYIREEYHKPGEKVAVSESEDEEMREQLRGLGYME